MTRCRTFLSALLAVLGTLTGAARLSAADKPEPSDDKLLFEGPVEGSAVIRRALARENTEIHGTILFVTKDALYIRPTRGTAVDVIDTPRQEISYILAQKDGKKLYWEWDPVKKEIAMRLISSAENSSLNWRAQYGYIEDIDDGRGYTGGIVGFCSGTNTSFRQTRWISLALGP